MSDHWADVRWKAEPVSEHGIVFADRVVIEGDQLRALLADADALLALARAYSELDEHTEIEGEADNYGPWKYCGQCGYKEPDGHWKDCPWAAIDEAIAALPEHFAWGGTILMAPEPGSKLQTDIVLRADREQIKRDFDAAFFSSNREMAKAILFGIGIIASIILVPLLCSLALATGEHLK